MDSLPPGRSDRIRRLFDRRSSNSGNRYANGLGRSSDVSLRRPGLDVGQPESPDGLQTRAIDCGVSQYLGKSCDITAGKYKPGINGRNQISCRTTSIACRHRTAAAHSFIHHQAEGLKFGR